MILTLKQFTKESVFNFAKMERKKWLMKYLGMCVLSSTQIWWTWRVEDAFRKVKTGNKYALKNELDRQSKELGELVEMVRSNLEAL